MSFGTYVKGIDGLMAGATSAWLYDVNDQSAEVGADSYKLKSGDVVVFRFVSDWSNISQETLKETLDKFGTCKTEEPDGGKPEEPKSEGQDDKTPDGKNQGDQDGKTPDGKNQGDQDGKTPDGKNQGDQDGKTLDGENQGDQDSKTRTTKARECSNSSEAIRGSNLKNI